MKHALVINALAHFTGPVPLRGVMARLEKLGHPMERHIVRYHLAAGVKLGTVQSNNKNTKARRYWIE